MEKVRITAIGCGGFMRYRLKNLLQIPEVEVVALVDPDPVQIDRTQQAYPELRDTPTFADLRESLKVASDAATIATPHTQHAQQVIACLESGRHVIVEKPMVTSTEDAHRVLEARDRSGKQAMISYQRHLQPEYRFIRDRLREKAYGEVRFVQALLSQEWKRFTMGTWRQDPALSGGGMLNDSGSHMLDVLLWMTDLRPESVVAFCDNRGTEVDIDTAMSVRFVGGALASITIAGDAHCWHEDTTIWCERGSFFLRGGKLTTVDEAGNKFTADHLVGGGSTDQNFIDAILGRAEVVSPFECGLRVIELTEAAWKSSAQGGAAIRVG
ncbi:MAG TPA: Gfo/Idh/MocA family oxidoreductase [Fimbriimonadaceae bacterium]|nr:Gfo/Idh/MocA family oxidoreductase [Fimbriimonadaceae bacterium]HRJ96112.1 Gfo/Idh/MocA family oxidoreductase [Fimbriimonadaceae bacterium]